MNRFCIVAKDDAKRDSLRDVVEERGFTWDEDTPSFVISYGGDGTLLQSEYQYPGIPKVVVRDSKVCYKCHDAPISEVLELIKDEEYEIATYTKLNSEGRVALNDITIRNADVRRAIRFTVAVDGDESETIIGDGIVAATPFGSSGYYHSITRSTVEEGYGIAFNNPTQPRNALVVDSNTTVTFTMRRGDAVMAVDNQEELVSLQADDQVEIAVADGVARLITT